MGDVGKSCTKEKTNACWGEGLGIHFLLSSGCSVGAGSSILLPDLGSWGMGALGALPGPFERRGVLDFGTFRGALMGESVEDWRGCCIGNRGML